MGENKLRGFIQKRQEQDDAQKSNKLYYGKQDKAKKSKIPDINEELLL